MFVTTFDSQEVEWECKIIVILLLQMSFVEYLQVKIKY